MLKENVMNLIGMETNLVNLDNALMEAGYLTVFNGSLVEIIEAGNVVYTENTEDQDKIILYFEVLEEVKGNTGLTVVKVLDVEEF